MDNKADHTAVKAATLEQKPRNHKQAQDAASEAKAKETPAVIYIGPTVGRGSLVQYTTFRGELPARVKELAEANPKLSRLIVPVAELANASRRAATPGTPEYSAVQSINEGKV